MLRTIGFTAAIVLISTAVAMAEDDRPDFARPGWYVGLGGSFGTIVGGDATTSLEVNRDVTPTLGPSAGILVPRTEMLTGINVSGSTGVNGRVGYRLHPHLAVELQVEYLPGFSSQGNYLKNTIVCDRTANALEICTPYDRQNWLYRPSSPDKDFSDGTFSVDRDKRNISYQTNSWDLKTDYNGEDGIANGARTVTQEVQRQTDLLVLTANAKIPLLKGRFQPFVFGGLGVYFGFSTNETPESGVFITGERLALKPGESESVRTGYTHGVDGAIGSPPPEIGTLAFEQGLDADLYAVDGFAPYNSDPNDPLGGYVRVLTSSGTVLQETVDYIDAFTYTVFGFPVSSNSPYPKNLIRTIFRDDFGAPLTEHRTFVLGTTYPDDLEYHETVNPNVGEMGLINSEVGFAMRFGGGVDLYFTEQFLLSFEVSWIYTPGFSGLPIDDPGFLSVGMGAQYRF